MKKKVTFLATAAILSSAAFATITAAADTHTVQKGDTLQRIANTYSTTVSELKNLNDLTSDTIYVHQTLTVQKLEKAAPIQVAKVNHTYTITKGDTLGSIAKRHNLTINDLKVWNALESDTIYAGQTLVIAANAPQATVPKATTGEAAPFLSAPQQTKAAQPSVSSPAPASASVGDYTIMPGDTLGKIASKHNLTIQQLKELNQLTSDTIYAGQTLSVSGFDGGSNGSGAGFSSGSGSGAVGGFGASPSNGTVVGYGAGNGSGTGIDTILGVDQLGLDDGPLVSANSDELLAEAKALLGAPYAFGGSDLDGFDCSGFLYYVYQQTGEELPRMSSADYYNRSYYVDKPMPGDLVFFENTYKQGISHLGIYLGDDEFIHADDLGVRVTSLEEDSYYSKHFESFKRFY